MRTPNTLHVQQCSVPGCLNEAQVTLAFGKYVTAPKGHCNIHTMADIDPNAAKVAEENAILADLGFDITGFKAA